MGSDSFTASGALGSWGAALREPYADRSNTNGLLLSDPEELKMQATRFWEGGFQVVSPCINRV
jgi:predicted amidohydrolase YtcJ